MTGTAFICTPPGVRLSASGPSRSGRHRGSDASGLTRGGRRARTMRVYTVLSAKGDLDAPPLEALAPAGLCPRPEVRPAGPADDRRDPSCRRVDGSSSRHLQDEASSTATQETPRKAITSNELAHQLANLPVGDEDAYVENRWCQLRDMV
ncbi:unnamed protein product [Schistocephalus solidus]|uniref:Transposase n=1 Tax=Schistocephalus solidus TaxID=70667 RepID=A0A183T5R1_SCHSO|nr:unnamed protein product [Schistocephalus solidus]